MLRLSAGHRSARGPFHPDGFGFMSMQGGTCRRRSHDEAMALVGRGGTTRRCRLPHGITEVLHRRAAALGRTPPNPGA
jgi:hypothetical protein